MNFEFLLSTPWKILNDFHIYLGTNIYDGFKEYINIGTGSISYSGNSSKFEYNKEEYHFMTLDVVGQQCMVYINDKYVHTFNLEEMVKSALQFEGDGVHLRNVSVKINE